jgi:hypothetical protein
MAGKKPDKKELARMKAMNDLGESATRSPIEWGEKP